MMEAVACNIPLIVTGNLPGQEEGNPGYLQKHNLGVVCKEPSQLKKIIEELLSNNAEKLNKIKEAQKNFLNPNIAKEIVDFILSMEKRGDINIPDNLPKFWDFGKRSVVGRKIIINRHNKTLR